MSNLSLAPESLHNLHMSPEKIDPWLVVYSIGLERGVCPHDRCIDRLGQGIMWLATGRLKTPSQIVDMLDMQCSENGLPVPEVQAERSALSIQLPMRSVLISQLAA